MNQAPVLYTRKEDCCGCTACYAICPKEAISMVEDEEGFGYPQIDEVNVKFSAPCKLKRRLLAALTVAVSRKSFRPRHERLQL